MKSLKQFILIVSVFVMVIGVSGCRLNRNPRLQNNDNPAIARDTPAVLGVTPAIAEQTQMSAQPEATVFATATPDVQKAGQPAGASNSSQEIDSLIKELQGLETDLSTTDLMNDMP